MGGRLRHVHASLWDAFYRRGDHFAVDAGQPDCGVDGNIFWNPLTYVPIGLVSLQTGHWILGAELNEEAHRSFGGKFVDAWSDLWGNLKAWLFGGDTDWAGLHVFYDEVFFPYLIGGIVPGIIAATICYYLSVPVIRAYQARRRGAIKAKFDALKAKAKPKPKGGAAGKAE